MAAVVTMRRFEQWQIRLALAHAQTGGQALHLHRLILDRKRAPRCFVRAVDRGEMIAHLIDQDAGRLQATVRALGVRVVRIERCGRPGQHVDLCGQPLQRALARCAVE